MTILAIDTSGPSAGVAVMRDGVVTYAARRRAGVTHSETILPMAQSALDAEGLSPRDVDAYACVAGPGSFTGVRIGVCAVKGMALTGNKPVFRIDALETLAYAHKGFSGIICPVLDARRGQVYGAAFRFAGGDRPVRVTKDVAMPLADFLRLLPSDEKWLFTGDAVTSRAEEIRAAAGANCVLAPACARDIDPGAACAIAAASEPMSGLALTPIYLRQPQAERERAQRGGV